MRFANSGVSYYDGDWFVVQNGKLMMTDENPRNDPTWVTVNDEDWPDDTALEAAMAALKIQLKTEFSIDTWGPDWHPEWSPADLTAYQAKLTRWYFQ